MDDTRNSPFLVPRGPGPFFTPRFPEEYILSLLGSSKSLPKFLEDFEKSNMYDYLTFLSKIKKWLNENFLESLKNY